VVVVAMVVTKMKTASGRKETAAKHGSYRGDVSVHARERVTLIPGERRADESEEY
jgi:hypothetical protein